MRYNRYISLALVVLSGSVAVADPMVLEAGEWRTSIDTMFGGEIFGEAVPREIESMTDSSCWATPDDLTLDMSVFGTEECKTGGTVETPFGLESEIACTFSGLEMSGNLIVEANQDKNAFFGRMALRSTASDTNIEAVTLFLGERTGPCS